MEINRITVIMKLEIDIIPSRAESLLVRAVILVIIYVETEVIVLIGNVIMHLTSY